MKTGRAMKKATGLKNEKPSDRITPGQTTKAGMTAERKNGKKATGIEK